MDYKERVVQGLVGGHEFASQLQFLLNKPHHHHDHDHHRELVSKILSSFTEAISSLTTAENLNNLATSSSVCESKKRAKEKRGCYKRKKNSESWTVVSNTVGDGHAWRKYGQKEILNAKHPRSYFRCSHKYDQGCKATKQVQRMEADSGMLCITYIGQHSCRDILSFPQIIATTDISGDNNHVMNPSVNVVNDHDHEEEVIKQEESDYPSSDITDNDLVLWKDFVASDTSNLEYTSGLHMDLDLDLMAKSIPFEFHETDFL